MTLIRFVLLLKYETTKTWPLQRHLYSYFLFCP